MIKLLALYNRIAMDEALTQSLTARVNALQSGIMTSASSIIAGVVRTQAGATALTAETNRVDTSTAPAAGSTLGDGVRLPVSAAGLQTIVINNTANNIQVYGAGADTINGIAGASGVALPPGDVAFFECAATGAWQYDAGMGSAGMLPVELAADNVAAAGATQGTATQLVAALNRVTTATALQGIRLPASAAGLDIIVENHTGVSITVYGNGNDQIDDVAIGTGLVQMDSSVVIYTCYAPGKWYTNGAATGYAKNPQGGVVLETMQYADALTAVGASQATALQLNAAVNTITSAAAGTGVNLPASAPGLSITVQNFAPNAVLVYPAQGSADTINGQAGSNGALLLPGSIGVFNTTVAGAWQVQPAAPEMAGFVLVNAGVAANNLNLTAAQISGAVANVDTQITAAFAAATTITLPTVASLVKSLHAPTAQTSYRLRITNAQAGAFAGTVTTNTGWTLTGNMAIAQNTWREFVVTITSIGGAPTATLQSVATGTFS